MSTTTQPPARSTPSSIPIDAGRLRSNTPTSSPRSIDSVVNARATTSTVADRSPHVFQRDAEFDGGRARIDGHDVGESLPECVAGGAGEAASVDISGSAV